MNNVSIFYSQLQRICSNRHRSVTSVVRGCGLSSCLVTAWKRGASPTAATIVKLAKELDVPAGALLSEDAYNTGPKSAAQKIET